MFRRLLLTSLVGLAFVAAPSVPAKAATTGYYWTWSDGSMAKQRGFQESAYSSPTRLPRLRIASHPARSGQVVRLEFRDAGVWRLETTARTGADGVATVQINPLCEAGRWCDETITYRLRVDGQTAPLSVRYYARQQANSFH